MINYYNKLFICSVLFFSISFAQTGVVRAESPPVDKLVTVLPDDVLVFAATSGGDCLKPDFKKSTLGRIWYDPGVQTFYQSIKKELLTKIKQEIPNSSDAKVPDIVMDFVKLVGSRPIIIGAAQKTATEGPPIYGFAILDAGTRKAEIASTITKLEALADEGDIVEVKVGSFMMHGPKDAADVPGYWGWVGNYLIFAVNDGEGLALKYLEKPRAAAASYLKDVSGPSDVLAVYVDCQKITEVVSAVAGQEGATNELDMVTAVIKELGFADVKSIASRAVFAGPDVVFNELLGVPEPRTGLLACLKNINLKMFDMVDARAVNAAAVNCDIAGVYDTIMRTIKVAAPNDIYTDIQQAIAEVESEVKFKIRKGLLESLSGPMIFYSLPAGVMMEAPSGGFVVIAKPKDAALLEKTMVSLGKFAATQSEGMLQVSSQVQSDGRTLHSWVIAPLAMMQIMPCWTVVDDHVVIASNMTLYNAAVKQIVSAGPEKKSLRTTEGYKKATAELPDNLIFLRYTDSKVQFTQLMTTLQQYWPMVTMVATQEGVELPVMLPSVGEIVKDMGPSCQYAWFDAQGLRSHYRGPGVEVSLGAVAGTSLGVGIMMPALARARHQAKQVVSGTNLSSIGKACLIYANDYDDKFPPNLQELVEKVELSPKCLESPRKPKDFDGPSYIYISGQTTPMHPGNIIAYENPEFCSDKINVLFLDSHVEAMKPDEFLRELEATYKRLGRAMPEIKVKGAVATEAEGPLIGQPASSFTLEDLDGKQVSLADFKGKVVLLDFWATWCGPCRQAIPHLEAIHKKYKDEGLVVIGINHERDHDKVRAFAKDNISYIVLLDADKEFKEYGIKGIPTAFYIDREGKTCYCDVGFGSGKEEKMEQKVKELLAGKIGFGKPPQSSGLPKVGAVKAGGEVKRFAIHKAASEGDIEKVKSLIISGADINEKNNKQQTPLYLAVQSGRTDMAALLITRGADVNVKGGRWGTPLHITARFGHRDIAEMLIAKGADVNAERSGEWTPLHLAARFGNTDMAELLVAKDANMYARTKDQMTPLLFAVLHDRKDIEKLLIEKGAEKDIFTETIRGNTNGVKRFLRKDPNLVHAELGSFTPLHWAAYRGHLKTAKLLIRKGADIEAGREYVPPLYWAVRYNRPDMAKLLIAKGADVNTKGLRGMTVLHYAPAIEIAKTLIEKGANVNAQDSRGATPLHYIVSKSGHRAALKLLIDFDDDISAEHSEALHLEAEKGQAAIAKLLITKGADVNAKDKNGLTPLDIAEKVRYKTLSEVLRKYRAEDTTR